MASTDSSTHLRYASDPDPQEISGRARRLQTPSSRIAAPPVDVRGRERAAALMELAQSVFSSTGSWVVFYREMLGVEGAVRKWYPEPAEYKKFLRSDEHAELQEMVAAMRSQDGPKGDTTEPERMITIRIPKSLHDSLTREAKEATLSINKLCISKLLQPIDDQFVPIQQGALRGRKPGPQGPRKKR